MISPVYNIKKISIDKIKANDYNPNRIASPEFKLLELSILEDGFTMPIVCYHNKKDDMYEIVDGLHRFLIAKNNKTINQREKNSIPVSIIEKPLKNRFASSIRHNRARGENLLELMQNFIYKSIENNKIDDNWMMKNYGLDKDELLRLKQLTGIKELFKDKDFSKTWVVG